MRILYGVTVPSTAKAFLAGQLADMVARGHEVHLVCSSGEELGHLGSGVIIHTVEMQRNPSPRRDLAALFLLIRLLRRIRPQVTVVGTPKAGLLVGLAALLAKVPRRFYLLRGLRLEGTAAPARWALALMEVAACRAAHVVVPVSPSLAAALVRLPGVGDRRVAVLGAGSSNGVDTQRFRPPSAEQRRTRRAQLGLEGGMVAGFVGRLGVDKGLNELMDAVRALQPHPELHFVIVGDLEGAADSPERRRELGSLGMQVTGFVSDTVPWYQAMDVLVLPTYREGFPNVVLEAAACGVPTITTWATGARDSVVDGETGVLVPVRDTEALTAALLELLKDEDLRARLGRAARARAVREFDQALVWRRYRKLWLEADVSALATLDHYGT